LNELIHTIMCDHVQKLKYSNTCAGKTLCDW